jgi:hypothetical protein
MLPIVPLSENPNEYLFAAIIIFGMVSENTICVHWSPSWKFLEVSVHLDLE